jgi:hypothetical protein
MVLKDHRKDNQLENNLMCKYKMGIFTIRSLKPFQYLVLEK